MAKLSHTDSRRMYSWWWDSHISPKNSKWLQQNLTDMDVKVKSMIKLIEVDEDSFARRAEMYYKKRPELMKMVEEFYRAYRALAERYDHATGVIRHAHRTMSEAFPNQLPTMFADESPASSVSGYDPSSPDSPNKMGEFIDESDNVSERKISKLFNGSFGPLERVRRGLHFDEAEDKEENVFSNGNDDVNDLKLLKLDQESDSKEIIALKEAIVKLEAEKEAGFAKYQQTLDNLSQLETEISKTREDFSVLRNHATISDTEVSALKDALAMLEAEKESKLQDYQKCLDKISMLQTTVSTAEDDAQKLNERANSAEMKAQSLKTELDELAVEKEAALNQYIQSLEIISNLENKLRLSEEDSTGLKERAEKAESEVNSLRRAISKLTEEKETAVLQYRHCLETICNLEKKLTFANEEAKRLNGEKENEVTKLLGAKEQCLMLERSNQSLHSELESLTLKMGAQSQELTEKQKELGRLLNCVQEERLRFVDAETAFQTLQHLHTQTQEEMRAMVSELQNRAQLLKVAETQKQSLQDEFLRVMEENKHLDDLNSSSALSIKDMQNEICSLTQSKEKLEEEVEQRLDERNALQQEIYCLKEELNDLRKKHLSDLEQVHSVGLNPEFLRKSVKELQEENSNLKETCQRESIDKAALMKKLEILDHLLEKNSLLETSLADLNAELDVVRGKIEELEKSCQSLMKEKSTLLNEKEKLMTQLQETNKKLEKLLENKTVLENSLSDAHLQLEALKAKSKILEDSCHLLVNDKADLICEKDGLTSQLEKTQKRLIDFEKLHGELEGRCEHLENVKESALRKVEELQMSMEIEKQNHASQIEMSRAQLTEFESEKHVLREECQQRKRELELVLDGAIASEIEIFILRTTSHVLKENNCSLVTKNQILLEKSSLSEKDISRLEQCNIEQHSKIRSLSDHFSCMRSGTRQLLNVFSIAEDCGSADTVELDQVYLNQLSIKLHHLKETLCEAEDINLEHSVALSVLVTWIKELGLHLNNVEVEKCKIDREFKIKSEQVLRLQSDTITLLEMNEELTSKSREGDCNKEALIIQIENLNAKLTDIQDTCQDFQRENEGLKTQLAAFGPEIVLLKECISSLEGQTGIHIKFQIPENVELQGSEGSQNPPESILNEDKKMLMPVSDVHDSRVRLQAIVKAADEMKELMVQENIDLRSKLDESTRKIELLQSESRKHRRNRRPTSEITEEDDALLTKDIVLDQISDGSYRYSKKEVANVDNEIVELWETADPDGTVGLSLSKSNKIVSPSTSKTVGFHRSRSTRRQKGGFGISDGLNEEDLSVDKLEISKRSTDSFQEGNRRKVLERLDSDVQRLANLQITVQDLKRKLEVTEKDKRGKTVIECETLKRQLGEADTAVMKLFDLNGRLKNSIDDMSFSDTKTSFDFEGEDGGKRRKVSEQARRMSEKIGRLQLEVQKLQFVLLKLDDENEGRSRMSETKRRILLRDYLYGGGRTGQRPKKSQFCVCVQPSPVEE